MYALSHNCLSSAGLRVTTWLAILALAPWVQADESRRLTLANNMIATEALVAPESQQTPAAAVLLIHGWAGEMDEVGDLYKRLAQQLQALGIASLRINIRGESEREEIPYRLSSTFESRVTDAQTGLDYLRQHYPSTPIGVVGFSLGGATALQLTGLNADTINSLVLWSSAGNPDVLFDTFSPEQHTQVMEQGEITLPYWVDLTITKTHYLGFDGYDVFTALTEYQGALLSIRGSEDYLAPIEAQLLEAATSEPEEYRVISGADHIFNTLDPNAHYDERVIEQTAHWLFQTLSPLTL